MSEQFIKWSTVQSWISKNPSKQKSIIQSRSTTHAAEIPVEESTDWSTTEVSPATPLSCVLFLQDATYQNLPESARNALLRESCTTLQESAAIHCKGRQFPVRKTAEGLAEVCLETRGEYSPLGLRALSFLRESQFVFLNEQKKQIHFAPEDIRTWVADKDVLFIQSDMRGVYHTPKGFQVSDLSKWLSDKEHEGWMIEYPIAEASLGMEELKKLLTDHNETITTKSTKDTLRKRVGKAQSIRALVNLVNDTQPQPPPS